MPEVLSRANQRLTADATSIAVKKFIGTVREWRRRAGSHQDLMALGRRDLRDLRLTRLDVLREARKSFWKE